MSRQYGKLRPTSGWDPFVSLGHPCKFQPVSRLGSVTAWHSSSGRQPNFAALNRGRHLYSAGRPSRWALAHISSSGISLYISFSFGSKKCNVPDECIFSITQRSPFMTPYHCVIISIHQLPVKSYHEWRQLCSVSQVQCWIFVRYLVPLEIISVVENIHSPAGTGDDWRARAEIDLSNFAQDWQWFFVALPEGEWFVIELRRNAHVKVLFYVGLRRVCVGRVHLSYQLHS